MRSASQALAAAVAPERGEGSGAAAATPGALVRTSRRALASPAPQRMLGRWRPAATVHVGRFPCCCAGPGCCGCIAVRTLAHPVGMALGLLLALPLPAASFPIADCASEDEDAPGTGGAPAASDDVHVRLAAQNKQVARLEGVSAAQSQRILQVGRDWGGLWQLGRCGHARWSCTAAAVSPGPLHCLPR